MLSVELSVASGIKHVFTVDTPLTVNNLENQVTEWTNLSREDFYIVHKGRLVYGTDICRDGSVTIFPKLLGGKGGFGSMLRAIGAQIEKTTNREACRDLSGRRLRDINEEKRLKAWIEKKTKREEEAAERKKKKLERLCAVPKHEFKDQCYERERSVLTERVGDAVEEGFKLASAGASAPKQKIQEVVKSNKRKTLLDLEIDSDELDSSDASDEDEVQPKKLKTGNEQVSNDSGHSSDESARADRDTNPVESEYSEASSDNQIGNTNLSTEDPKEDNAEVATSTESMESTETCSAQFKAKSTNKVAQEEK